MHIKRVELVEFRRFTHLVVQSLPPTAKLVILAGPNGNGKSSFFDGFLVFYSMVTRGLQWNEDYHIKKLSEIPRQRGHGERVMIAFHEEAPDDEESRNRRFYFRTAYRNDPEFTTAGLSQVVSPLIQRRFGRLIDNDAAVAMNYQSIASRAVAELYGHENEKKTYGDFRQETRGVVNKFLNRLMPDLSLTDLGRPLENGTFFFSKGASKNFPYKNLSGGEKAIFDIILDLVVKRDDFNNSIYVIDEPESHINPRLHGEFLRVLVDLIPDNCQLWLGTHAIGILRSARDLENTQKGTVAFLDFDKDFDQPQTLQPAVFGRNFWEKSLSVSFADMAALVAPRMIIRCEGAPGDGFDAHIYETIFENELPDVRFVSSGSANDLAKDVSLITAALEGKIAGLEFRKLYDRDSRSAAEIDDSRKRGDRVLSRRHIESYLFDDEALRALCAKENKIELEGAVLDAKGVALAASAGRGNSTDDMKSASGEAFTAIRRILGMTQGGNSARSFMRDTLAPLITAHMIVYKELRTDIFG